MMWSTSSLSQALRLSVAALTLGAAPALLAAAAPADGTASATKMFQFEPAMASPASTFRYETAGISSSVPDAAAMEGAALGAEGLGGSAQPPTSRRRSYGRSRYEDRLHNSDGSTKIAFVAGAGLNVPVANTGKFYTPSYDITAGAGYNFNKMFGVLAEFHYDHMGVTGGAINAEYNNLMTYYGATADDLDGFDANAHVIALTVNPVVTFSNDRSRFGAYATAGVGYYRKTTNFTLPAVGQSCDSYFCYTYASNYNIDSASANGYGVNGGLGLTYKLSSFSTERLFVEARYHWIKIDSANNTDFFQYNRRNSEMIPLTAGIRF